MQSNGCRMTTWGLGLVLAGWLLASLLGCCGHNTQRDYGHSVEHNIAMQVVDQFTSAGDRPPKPQLMRMKSTTRASSPEKNSRP
jgi:hypothetical protein